MHGGMTRWKLIFKTSELPRSKSVHYKALYFWMDTLNARLASVHNDLVIYSTWCVAIDSAPPLPLSHVKSAPLENFKDNNGEKYLYYP
jgi:hypothetical protein